MTTTERVSVEFAVHGKPPTDCPFCKIARSDPHEQILQRTGGCIVIEPLNPVTKGHRLVIPMQHIKDAAVAPGWTAATMRVAAEVARSMGPCNIITSVGAEATQTVFHLHVHVIPRSVGDGLSLPWTDQNNGG